MRLASYRNVLALSGSLTLGALLGACPENGSASHKTVAEPERAEPDDDGKAVDGQKNAVPAAAPPAPAAAPADDRKPDEDKDRDK